MPRLRFTVRWMMVVVAVVAIGLWVALETMRLLQVSRDRAAEAYRWADLAKWTGRQADGRQSAMDALGIREGAAVEDTSLMRRQASWMADKARKYDRAAHHPWLPVAPEPPESK